MGARQGRVRRVAGIAVVVGALACGSAGCAESEDSSERRDRPRTAAAESSRSPEKSRSAEPVVTHRTVRKKQQIPFSSQTRATADLKKGVTTVARPGRHGLRVNVYRVTLRDGVESGRKLIDSVVVRKAVPRLTLRGTRVDPPEPRAGCDPNYAGACVPISSDVDCGGGSGNGPGYVDGTVRVVGSDIYDLDHDGDGYGCD